jgi:hypothetical protein
MLLHDFIEMPEWALAFIARLLLDCSSSEKPVKKYYKIQNK